MKFDLIEKVHFCKEHREFYKKKVRVRLSDGTLAIQPKRLGQLIRQTEKCTSCIWETTFGDSLRKTRNMEAKSQ